MILNNYKKMSKRVFKVSTTQEPLLSQGMFNSWIQAHPNLIYTAWQFQWHTRSMARQCS